MKIYLCRYVDDVRVTVKEIYLCRYVDDVRGTFKKIYLCRYAEWLCFACISVLYVCMCLFVVGMYQND